MPNSQKEFIIMKFILSNYFYPQGKKTCGFFSYSSTSGKQYSIFTCKFLTEWNKITYDWELGFQWN